MQRLKDILATLLVLAAVGTAVMFAITNPAMAWLHAHGMGMHVPSNGPLHEEYRAMRDFVGLCITALPVMLALALIMEFCSRRQISWWRNSEPEAEVQLGPAGMPETKFREVGSMFAMMFLALFGSSFFADAVGTWSFGKLAVCFKGALLREIDAGGMDSLFAIQHASEIVQWSVQALLAIGAYRVACRFNLFGFDAL